MTEDDDPPPEPWAASAGWRWVPDRDEGIVDREHSRRLMRQTHEAIIESLTAYARTLRWVHVPGARRRVMTPTEGVVSHE